MVVAHPDDDAYGVAGLVAIHAQDPGFRFVLVHATDGEAGQIAEGTGVTRAMLGVMRREEDERAWRTLGRPPDRHEWFGYPDGAVAGAPFDEVVDRITNLLADERPDAVLTFGPDGITGHPDHITIGRATTEAFLRLAGDGGPGLRRLAYGAIRQSVIDRWNHQRAAAGLPPWDPDTTYHLRGVPDDQIGIVIDTAAVAPRVRAAMREHRSQWADMNPAGVPEPELEKNVARETQVIAWPRTRAGHVLSDIFEDL